MLRLQVLDDGQLKQVHEATLTLLADTGIVLTHSEVRELLLEHGATADGDRVLLPSDLVEKCVAQCPQTVRQLGRDPKKAIELGDGGWHPHNVGGVPNVHETETGIRRPATREDVIQVTHLPDALPNIASVTPLFTPQDVPMETLTLWMHYDTVANTTKPLLAPGVQTDREVRALADMASIACPDYSLTMAVSPISPLTFPDNIVDAMLEIARLGLILGSLPCPIMGATAPMSMAGALTQQNAEVLASIVIGQPVRPGLPSICKGRISVMNPRTGLSVWGNPEIGLISAATVQVGHYYGLPVDVCGLTTNAHILNIQNGYERAFGALTPVLAEADEISGVGEMDGGVTTSLTQVIIDDEILASVDRIRRGFEVNADSLASNVIGEVMRGGRNFLAEMHTVSYLRSGEISEPKVATRDSWEAWETSGRLGMVKRAEEKMAELLAEHEVEPLSEAQEAEMRKVIRAEERG